MEGGLLVRKQDYLGSCCCHCNGRFSVCVSEAEAELHTALAEGH